MGGMERLKRESSERLSDGTEKHDPNMLYLGRFDVEKLRFLLKMLGVDIQNCACYPHGEYIFRKIVRKIVGRRIMQPKGFRLHL